MPSPDARLTRWQRTRFALGDLSFNLYWQSVTLYLLFYYTDVVGLPVAQAALIYMLPSIWDGLVDFAVGLSADRMGAGRGGYRRFLLWGALPLGAAFVLLYLPLPAGGRWTLAAMLAAHLLFRTLYAVVNVPYSALTARITASSDDRASIAGLRMLFGTIAAVAVALVTQPLAQAVGGHGDDPLGFFAAATLFALVGSAILLPVAATIVERVVPAAPPRPIAGLFADSLRSLAANRAFVSLMAAVVCMTFAATVFGKSVLYYFKYVVGDEGAGQGALAVMGIAGGVAVPLWMALGKQLGARAVWLAAVAASLAVLGAAALADPRSTLAMQAFFVALQVTIMGLHFAFWALLPDTIEYGERATGLRFEATTFGVAALVAKVAFGLAGGLFGALLDGIGYQANAAQAPATLDGLRWIVFGVPAAGLALSALCIALNPLKRGVHDRIVDELAGSSEGEAAAQPLG